METLGREKGKGRERACWAERVRVKKAFSFSETIQTLSI
jgi:hypothetical protein